MATKIRSKGTALLMEIASVYTAIPLLKSISISGAKANTFPSTTLDGAVYETHDGTGFTSAPTISAEGFRDPDDTVQLAFIAKLAVSPPVATNFKVTYVDATPLSEIYSCVGYGFDTTVAMSDGLACSYSLQTSGTPS